MSIGLVITSSGCFHLDLEWIPFSISLVFHLLIYQYSVVFCFTLPDFQVDLHMCVNVAP